MGAGILQRDNFSALLTPLLAGVCYDNYDRLAPQAEKVFNVDMMSEKTETKQHMGGFGFWDTNTEGNTINEDSMSQGDDVTFTATRKDKGYDITWEMVQDDLYGVLSGGGSINGKYASDAASHLGYGGRTTMEKNAAEVLTGGFSNVGYDGVALFHNSHPITDGVTATADNLASGALNQDNLESALTLLETDSMNGAGLPIVAESYYLIVPVQLKFTAAKLLQSQQQAYETSNTKNVLPMLEVVALNLMNKTSGTYKTTNWFVKARNIKNIVIKWREKIWYGSQFISRTPDMFMYGYGRWTQGYEDYRGIVGSTGV